MSQHPAIALITGAGKGIGSAIAVALAKNGTYVYINYQSDTDSAQKTLETITAEGGTGALCPFDVTDDVSAGTAVKQILEDHGRIDILVNNAGIKDDRLLAMMKKESWDRVMDVNLNSFYAVTKPVVKAMIKQHSGRIVNLTSTAGQMGNPGQVNYSASKAGLIGATRALAREVANRSITVNAVSPGFIQTRMTEKLDAEVIEKSIPAKRMGTPEEVADLVVFLCSENASYITGQVIGINGGLI